jgi:hypothetical protein
MNEKEITQHALGNIQKDGTIHLEWKELRILHLDKIKELALTKKLFIIVAQQFLSRL